MNVGAGAKPVKTRPIVALTTDFGLEDAYVGILKGVILSRCPGARLVDVTHGLPPQDVLAGVLALEAARPYFPRGTIHLAVVDPGVGTERAALAVGTERDWFVAPDNGLLSFVSREEILEVRRIENSAILLRPTSRTFHGRDVFAPAAAHLAAGRPPEELGPEAPLPRPLGLPIPRAAPGGLVGEVLAFDHFGNALTNVRREDLPASTTCLRVGEWTLPLVPTYGAVPPGQALGLVGSSGRVEISVREGSAQRELGMQRGDPVVFS